MQIHFTIELTLQSQFKNRINLKRYTHLLALAILGSVVSWLLINKQIIEISFWRYLLVETIIIVSKMIYEKEKERFDNKGNAT